MKENACKIIVLLLLITMLTLAFNVQQAGSSEPPETEWSRTYGGINDDTAWSVVQTSDGGYAIAGYTQSFGAGSNDFWLVKIDADGNEEWNKTYGGTDIDCAFCVVQTVDEGYALAGQTNSFGAGNYDFWLVKTDSAGNTEWNKTYGGTNMERGPNSLIQINDGGYVLTGETWSFGAGTSDLWLVKTDANGIMQWNKTYGRSKSEEGWAVVQTADGGFAVAGMTDSFGAGVGDFWLVKTDADGNMQWNRTYGGSGQDEARSLVQVSDGGYVLAGMRVRVRLDAWLVKTDINGIMQWDHTFGGAGEDSAWSVVQTSDGGYALAGDTDSYGSGDRDFWLIKTDSGGNAQWNDTYGGPNEDWGRSLVHTLDGGYAIAGYTNSFGAGGYDCWLIKIAPEEIPATFDIDPDTLNLKSNGQWITAYVTLPEGYNVEDIVLETVYLDGIPAAWSEIQDRVYMVKFDRATVQASLTNEPDYDSAPKFYDMTLAIKGTLVDGTPFEGSDTIRVLSK